MRNDVTTVLSPTQRIKGVGEGGKSDQALQSCFFCLLQKEENLDVENSTRRVQKASQSRRGNRRDGVG